MKDRGAAGKSLAEKNKRIAKLLSALNGKEMSIPDVAALLEVIPKTAKNLVVELKLAGKVEVDNGAVRLPAQAAQESTRTAIFPDMDNIINLLPTPGHRAFMRLLLGVTVSRFHLAATIKDGWPAGIVYGPTGAFKTAMGIMAARIFGLKDEAVIRVVGRETSRSLLGRRMAAGKGTMTFRPSEYLAGPIMVLDEADKTGQELRQDLLLLLQGDSVLELEQVRFTARATPLVTFNADRIPGWLHPAYLRRSFVLDTTEDHDRRAVAQAALAVFANLPRLNLGALKPPIRTIPDDLVAELDEHVGRFLTAGGAAVWDARYISKAALGYVSLGRMPLRRALLLVGRDYLVTAATMAQTKGDFGPFFDHLLAGLPAESLPAVVEEPEPEEEPGYSLDDLCAYWVEGAKMSVKVGMQCGEDQYWTAGVSTKTRFPIEKIGRGRTEYRPDKDYILAQVVHVLGFPASLAQKKRFDDSAVQKVFVAGKNEGWHTGREVAWNRLVECCENQSNDRQCCHVWWNLCHGCRQQNKRLSSGKKVVQLQRRGDIWE